jgi:hypothetical protein
MSRRCIAFGEFVDCETGEVHVLKRMPLVLRRPEWYFTLARWERCPPPRGTVREPVRRALRAHPGMSSIDFHVLVNLGWS